MNRFLKHTISIIALTIGLLYLADFIYTQAYIKSKPRNKLQYIMNTKNNNFDIVFIGSSRVANHVDIKLFDSLSNKKTINLGVEGAGLNDNLLQLKLLISENHISNVFLQIDTNFEVVSPSNIANSEAMPFLHNRIIKNHLKRYLEEFDKLEYIPFYRYAVNDQKIGFREFFFSCINKEPRVDPRIGFSPKFGNMIPSVKKSLPDKIRNKNIILNEIIEICKKKRISLTLFISPYCSKIGSRNYTEKLEKKYPNLIDLSRGYSDSLFYNCSHLNNRGAKKFTVDLYNKTKSKIETFKQD